MAQLCKRLPRSLEYEALQTEAIRLSIGIES
jgi:hypothetical protein